MFIKVTPQVFFQRLMLFIHCRAHLDERSAAGADILNGRRRGLIDQRPAGLYQIADQIVDHPPDYLMPQAARAEPRPLPFDPVVMQAEQIAVREAGECQQARPQAVISVMVIIGDLVGDIGYLRLQTRSLTVDKAPAYLAQGRRVLLRAVFQDAFAGLEGQVQTGKGGIALFQPIDDPERLQVMLKAALPAHAGV